EGKTQEAHVDQFRLDSRALGELRDHEPGHVLAQPSLARRPQYYRDRKGLFRRRIRRHLFHLSANCRTWPSGSRRRIALRNPSSPLGSSTTPGETKSARPWRNAEAAPAASAVKIRVCRWRMSLARVSGAGRPSRGARYSRNSIDGPLG